MMERYKLEIVNNHGDRYIRCEPDPAGGWVMFKDVEAMQKRVAELETALATARREGMEGAAKIADSCGADWTKSARGKFLETRWDYESRADAADEIAAAIRAAAKEGKP